MTNKPFLVFDESSHDDDTIQDCRFGLSGKLVVYHSQRRHKVDQEQQLDCLPSNPQVEQQTDEHLAQLQQPKVVVWQPVQEAYAAFAALSLPRFWSRDYLKKKIDTLLKWFVSRALFEQKLTKN